MQCHRLNTVAHTVAGAQKARHAYTYDAWGNRITHAENLSGVEVAYGYEYDELDRLTRMQYSQAGTTTLRGQYRYDILNNRTRVTDAVGNYAQYVYDTVGGVPTAVGAQQLNQIDLYSAQGVKQSTLGTFGYDAAGNLLNKAAGGVVQSLTWDANNDLRQVETRQTANGVATNYSEVFDYDHEGRRINRLMLTGNTLYASMYLYNGEDIHKEYGTQWINPVAIYTHGPGRDDPLIYQSAAGNRYYHADGLGTPSVVTDALGNVYAYRVHDAWGAFVSGEGTVPAYGFTGREPDLSTGYVYYRARYYDPMLGRFLSRDPIGLQGGVNPYAYVDNNPVNNTDPDGLFARSVSNTLGGVGSVASGYYDSAVGGLATLAPALPWAGGASSSSPGIGATLSSVWSAVPSPIKVGIAAIAVPGNAGQTVSDTFYGAGSLGSLSNSTNYRDKALLDIGISPKSSEARDLQVHHVVAQQRLEAAPARAALKAVGMTVNDLPNLLVLSNGGHANVHDTAYYQAVNLTILSAVPRGRQEVVNRLNLIKASLLIKGSYP